MLENEIKCLVDFFITIKDKYQYVVMRNANELPFDNFSNDIDILIEENDFFNFEKDMKAVFISNGFDQLERSSFHGIECFTFYNIKNEIPSSLKIDLFFNIEGGGVIYYKFKDIIDYRIKNNNDIYVFDLITESLLTAIKTIVSGGKLKQKYLIQFIENKPNNKHKLINICPSISLKNHLQSILETNNNPFQISRKKILFEVFYRNIQESFTMSILRIMKHFSLEVNRAFSRQYTFYFTAFDRSSSIQCIKLLQENSKTYVRSNADRIVVIYNNRDLNIKCHSFFYSFFQFIRCLYEYLSKVIFLQRKCKIIFYLDKPKCVSTLSLLNILPEHQYNEQFNEFLKTTIRNITVKI